MLTQTLQIRGMTCGSCVARVETALRSVPGVTAASVNLATNLASVDSTATPDSLAAAVQNAGYQATPLADGASAKTLRTITAEQNDHVTAVRRRLILGTLFTVPLLLLDLLHSFGPHIHSAPRLIIIAAAEILFGTLVVFHTGSPFFRGAARALAHRAANMDLLVALGSGTAYLFSLVISALTILNLLSLSPLPSPLSPLHPEYHAAAMIIVLVTLGKYLEARAKRASNTAVASLATQSAATATRLRPDNSRETVPAESLAIGDRVEILAHQTLPVDGTLLEGSGSLDQSILTGESVPIELSAQSPVSSVQNETNPPPSPSSTGNWKLDTGHSPLPAGSTLLNGRILICATATAANSTVARILALVQSAQAGKTAIQGLADRVAGIFVPIILALAALTFLLHYFLILHGPFTIEHFTAALLPTIAVIVVACPCAMGLATPTALTVAVGRAAKNGILFTNSAALETAGRGVSTVIFDKTGTLTLGNLAVAEIIENSAAHVLTGSPSGAGVPTGSSPSGNWTPDIGNALQLAASLEQFSDHPLALAILAHARSQNIPLLDPSSFSSTPGGGVTGEITIASDPTPPSPQTAVRGSAPATTQSFSLAAGSLAFLQSLGIDLSPFSADITRLQSAGLTLVALAQLPTPPSSTAPSGNRTLDTGHSPRLRALFALRDQLRPDAAQTIAALRAQHIRVGVLSGDSEPAVRGTLAHIPLDLCLANVKPDQKAATLQSLRNQSKIENQKSKIPAVAFVGDGINDAPALAAADLGITLSSGTNLAKSAGDVILLSPHLLAVPQTLSLARHTLRIIRQNLFWAFGYNLLAVPLAISGNLSPTLAAAFMILSSLLVVTNSLRLYRLRLNA